MAALPLNDDVISDGEIQNVSNFGSPSSLVDVPISQITNDALFVHLYINENDDGMAEDDWLDGCDSTPIWDAKEDIDVYGVHSKGIYDLNVISNVESGLFKKSW